jgi:hypothetical protein
MITRVTPKGGIRFKKLHLNECVWIDTFQSLRKYSDVFLLTDAIQKCCI